MVLSAKEKAATRNGTSMTALKMSYTKKDNTIETKNMILEESHR